MIPNYLVMCLTDARRRLWDFWLPRFYWMNKCQSMPNPGVERTVTSWPIIEITKCQVFTYGKSLLYVRLCTSCVGKGIKKNPVTHPYIIPSACLSILPPIYPIIHSSIHPFLGPECRTFLVDPGDMWKAIEPTVVFWIGFQYLLDTNIALLLRHNKNTDPSEYMWKSFSVTKRSNVIFLLLYVGNKLEHLNRKGK